MIERAKDPAHTLSPDRRNLFRHDLGSGAQSVVVVWIDNGPHARAFSNIR
jgi:hypothetical protein